MEIAGQSMTKKQTAIISFLSVAAFILALLVSGRYWLRLDLTKSRAYTISKVSRNLHTEIPEPVNITYFLSDKLRTVVPAPGEIEDTLREYAAYSRGKIRVTVRDPVKSGLSGMMEEIGLYPMEIQNVEQDQASFITVYSGIVIEFLDRFETLPWVISTDTLEYDLTSRIRAMVADSQRQIGVLVGDSYRQWDDENFGYLNRSLSSAGFRVRVISAGDEIPDTLAGLFVIGGVEDLDDWALYRIDRYIQLGGKVMFAVKGVYVDTVYGSLEARHQRDRGLLDMIASYGVTIRPELVLDRNSLTLPYQVSTPYGGIQISRVRNYSLWISVLEENGNPQHPVSSAFTGLHLYWASPLELHTLPDVEAEPLFTTTKEAWLMRENFYTNPMVMYMLELEAAETKGTKTLGASLSGEFPSFFRGAEKPVREGSDEELPDLPQRASPSRLIVIGETDFTTNLIGVTQAAHNLDFLTRAADWLVNDDDIINIRNRQPQAGRFDKILDPGRRLSAMRFSQIFNVVIVPLFVIAAGLIAAYRRKARSRNREILTLKESRDDV
jgi:ABC-type uncharacterized transport system involved in gliding motility auxiliary subunit